MRIKNVNPRGGALYVPLLNRTVEHGEIVDVTEGEAELLLVQEDNWRATDKAAREVADTIEPDATAAEKGE